MKNFELGLRRSALASHGRLKWPVLGAALLTLSSASPTAWAQTTPNAPPVNTALPARITATLAPAATAPARAALVQIIDDKAHSPYQEGGFTNCTFAGACTVSYSAVPAGHRRLIEHFSCSVYVPSPGALRYVALLANTFAAPRDFFSFTRSPADAAQSFINSATLLTFSAGESPEAYAYADAGPIQELFCTVSGRDIVLP